MEAHEKNKFQWSQLLTVEFWASVVFFLGVALNDTIGDVPGLNLISKGLILVFMVLSAFLIIAKNIHIPLVFSTLLLANLMWWACSCLWSPGSTAFVSTLAQNVLLCFLTFMFFTHYKNYDIIFYAMFFSGIALAIYSLSVLGVDGFMETLQADERIGEGITNANTFGKVFSYGIVSGLYLVFFKRQWLCSIGCVFFLFFALSSGSKKSILIILIGAAVLLFIKYGFKHPMRMILGAVAVLVILYCALQHPLFSVANERFFGFINAEQDYGDRIRERMIERGVELFFQKPITGWGITAFQIVSGFHNYSHNNYVELLANYGIIGFSLFYSLYGYCVFGGLIKKAFRDKMPVVVAMITILISVLITDWGIVSYGIKWNWMVIGVAGAMAYSFNKGNRIKNGGSNDKITS